MEEDIEVSIRLNRSLRRAISRGQVGPHGERFPHRPFSNKGNSCKRKGKHSRENNEYKKKLYNGLLHRKAL